MSESEERIFPDACKCEKDSWSADDGSEIPNIPDICQKHVGERWESCLNCDHDLACHGTGTEPKEKSHETN